MYKYLLLFLISFKAFAFGAWIDESTIPPVNIGSTGVHTSVNNNMPLSTPAGGKVRLRFSVHKYAYEDPIVFPGQARAGHLHMFFGNSCITGASTIADLMACDTSTMEGGSANKSAYWMPAIIDARNGAVMNPYQTLLYYTIPSSRSAIVQAFPEGLKMIAGDSKATGKPLANNPNIVFYCKSTTGLPNYRLDPNGVQYVNNPDNNFLPNCRGDDIVHMDFVYPSCWNGVDLDSTDHKSHMAYPLQFGACPSTHPVALPVITAVFDWKVPTGSDSNGWRLSSDMYDCNVLGGYSMHMDYWAGWQSKYINMIVTNALRGKKELTIGWIGLDPDVSVPLNFVP